MAEKNLRRPPPLTNYQPPTEPPAILHQDDDILIADKPAGLLSVPGKAAEHADCLLHRLVDMDPSILLIHRLDMDTSGLMVFARNRRAQRHLGLQFERRVVEKTYEALVAGDAGGKSGIISLPLTSDWPNRPLQKVCCETGRAAETAWEKLGRAGTFYRMHLMPKTGRSHQLRVHMRAIGTPIVGDRFYAPAAIAEARPRLMLHACKLSLRHPTGGAWMHFESAPGF